MLMLSYMWSKVTDVDGPTRESILHTIQNIYHLKAEHGIAAYDVPHRFVASYVYRLPIGRGGDYLTGTPVVKDVIGGWELSGITELQVGVPLGATQSNNTGGFTETQRPNRIAPAVLSGDQRSIAQWFSAQAFTVAAPYPSGNEPRYSFYAPGVNNWDVALMRNFKIRERLMMQFRGGFYNALNHPDWNKPNTRIGAAAFGKVACHVGPRVTEMALRFFF